MQALSDLNLPEIRCIILRAPSGSKVFSAGHDIHELPSGGRDPLSYDDPLRQITRMIQNSRNRSFRWWKVVSGVAHLK